MTARESLAAAQLAGLRRLVAELVPHNRFYAPRLAQAGLGSDLESLEAFTARMPFTTKHDVVEDQARHPPYGSNLTYPLERYVRCHQTSGTSGQPLVWLDTAESWAALLDTWTRVFTVAGVGPRDTVFIPFSFGPFLGFWTAFEAATRLGCRTLAGGGMSTKARRQAILDHAVTVLCCTPTYALHLGEEGLDPDRLRLERIFVAGEPGGSVPAVRERIARRWHGAQVFDHHGMTEVGPVSFPNPLVPDVLHVDDRSFLAEVLDPTTGRPVPPGEVGELVLTTLARLGSPLLRYRTGDLVRLSPRGASELGVAETALEGGILARADDMVVVRGVNLYPSAVEAVIRGEAEVGEYGVEIATGLPMTEVRVRLEPAPTCVEPEKLARRLEEAFRTRFQLRIPVIPVAPGELPRFELKARRWVWTET